MVVWPAIASGWVPVRASSVSGTATSNRDNPSESGTGGKYPADIRSISLEADDFKRSNSGKFFSKSDQWGNYQRENLRHQSFSKGKFNASYLQPWISIISLVFKQEINSRKKATPSMPFSSEKFDISAFRACDFEKILFQKVTYDCITNERLQH